MTPLHDHESLVAPVWASRPRALFQETHGSKTPPHPDFNSAEGARRAGHCCLLSDLTPMLMNHQHANLD